MKIIKMSYIVTCINQNFFNQIATNLDFTKQNGEGQRKSRGVDKRRGRVKLQSS